LKDLQLAHPVTEDDSFEIRILVGADYYWTFIQDHIIRGDGPTAVQSRLGYLLSGSLLQISTAVTLVHVNFTAVDSQDLNTFWKTKTSGLSPDTDIDGSFLKAYMQSSITRQPNGVCLLIFPGKRITLPYHPISLSVLSVPDR